MLDNLLHFLGHVFTGRVNEASLNQSKWTDAYRRLDAKHNIAQRGINLDLFMRAPEQYEHWITFYFANLALFDERVGLHFFITNDPADIVKVLMDHPKKPEVYDLLCSSQLDLLGDSGAVDITLRVPARKPMRTSLAATAVSFSRSISIVLTHVTNGCTDE